VPKGRCNISTRNRLRRNYASHTETYDVFISHASEDKDFVRPLAQELRSLGLNVWYDSFVLRVGDNLARSIDIGLSKSRYGIVVLSKAFFAKNWPEEELDILISRAAAGRGAILPVWHGVSSQEVADYSAFIANLIALDTARQSVGEISRSLLEVISPERWAELERQRVEIEQASITDLGVAQTTKQPDQTRIVFAKFNGPVREDFAVDRNIADGLRSILQRVPTIEIVDLGRSLPTKAENAYQLVAAAQSTKASILVSGEYVLEGDALNLSLSIHIGDAPYLPISAYNKTISEPIAAFRRSDVQLNFTKTLASLALSIAAQKRFKEADYVGATQLFGAALEAADEAERFSTETIFRLRGLALFAVNQYSLAVGDLSEALNRGRNVASLSNRGIALLEGGNAKEALSDFDEALLLDPQSVFALTNRASALSKLERHEEAVRDLSRVIVLSPKFAVAYYNRGNAYFSMGKNKEAIGDYDTAIRLDPRLTAARSRKAYTLDAMGDFVGAMAEYEHAMTSDPGNFAPFAGAAQTKLHLGDIDGAIGLCNRAISMSAENVDVRQTRGIAFYLGSDFESALVDFDTVVKRRTTPVATDHVNRARAYAALGELAEAARDYQSAIELAKASGNMKLCEEIHAELRHLRNESQSSGGSCD
jgi:tetratricopeptide (TPR) repeat protein